MKQIHYTPAGPNHADLHHLTTTSPDAWTVQASSAYLQLNYPDSIVHQIEFKSQGSFLVLPKFSLSKNQKEVSSFTLAEIQVKQNQMKIFPTRIPQMSNQLLLNLQVNHPNKIETIGFQWIRLLTSGNPIRGKEKEKEMEKEKEKEMEKEKEKEKEKENKEVVEISSSESGGEVESREMMLLKRDDISEEFWEFHRILELSKGIAEGQQLFYNIFQG